jgi:SAM-dependent methyltransferase
VERLTDESEEVTVQERKLPQTMLPRGFAGRVTFTLMNRFHKTIYKNVAEALELKPEDDLLEVACGNGYFLKKYASHVHSVSGLDFSELAIKLAIKNNKDRMDAGTAKFVHGEASQLAWEDNKFSCATVMASIHAFPKPLEALKEIYRVLRPEGRLVVSIEQNAEDGLDHSKNVKQWGMHVWKEDDIRAMMKDAGFSEVSINYTKGFMMPKGMVARGIKQ